MGIITKGREAAKRELDENKKRQEAARLKELVLRSDEETNILFLDHEPAGIYVHRLKNLSKNGKAYWIKVICTTDKDDPSSRCSFCEAGHRPSYQHGYPVVDRRNFEIIKDKAGKYKETKVTMTKRGGTFNVLLVGANTIPVIEKKYDKYPEEFKNIQWNFYRTGEGTDATYHIEKSDLPKIKKFGETKEEKDILKQFKAFSWEAFFTLPQASEIRKLLRVNGLIEETNISDEDAEYEGEESETKENGEVKF